MFNLIIQSKSITTVDKTQQVPKAHSHNLIVYL
jgi:hypothetical protein